MSWSWSSAPRTSSWPSSRNPPKVARSSAEAHAKPAGRLIGFLDRIDDLAVDRLRPDTLHLACERLAGAGHAIAVEKPGIEKLAHDHLDTADISDIDHRILAIGPGIGEHRDDILREMVELLRRHDVLPEIGEAGGAGDLRRV